MPPPSRQSRHLWVGNLPEDIDKDRITDYFSRFGKVEGVHILPQRYPGQGIAAFVDFYDVHAAVDAVQTAHTISGREIRVNYKFKDGGGPRFGRHEQSPSRHEKERYGDKKTQRRSRSKSASSTSSSSSSTSAVSKSKDGSRQSSAHSRSSSSSSSSSSDTTRDDEKKKKKKSRSRSRSPSPGPRLGLFVKVSNLSSRPSDNTLREDLYFELRKHCDLHTVRIYRDNEERYAVVKFRNVADSQKMYTECNEMTFMGHKIKLSPWHPERRRSFYDNYPPGERHYGHPFGGHPSHMHHYGSGGQPDDNLEPDTTRTLFVGNIPRGISVYELRDYFIRFGHILDVEIKKMSGQATYGFVLFFDLMSACAAKRFMDGALIGRNTIKVGFGKGTPSKSLWVDGVDPTMTDAQVEKHFSNYGTLINIGFDRQRCTVVVVYTNVETAKEAMLDLRGTIIGKTRVRVLVDFCSKEARAAFFQALEHGDLDGPDFPPGFDPWVPPGPGRGGYHPHGGRQFFRGGPHQMEYGYQPFMEGRGGGYPVDRMGHRGHHDPDYDDYGEQLRAYSAKKERQRRHRHRSSSSESGRKSRSSSEEGERSSKKGKKKRSKVDNDKEPESDVEEKNKSGGKKGKSKEESAESDSDTDREIVTKKTKTKKKASTPVEASDDDKGSVKDEKLTSASKGKKEENEGNNDNEEDTTKKQILKFKVTKKPKIEPSAMLSSESDNEAKIKEDMAALSRKKLLAREAEKQNGVPSKEVIDQVIPKDEEISGGELSDMEDDVDLLKKTERPKQNSGGDDDDASSEKKGKNLKDKRSRSYRGKAADAADSDEAASLKKDDGKNNRKNKSGTKELPLRYREDDDSSVKRGRYSDRPISPSSPPVFDRHQQKRYGSSPRRHGRRRSQGSSSPQHHRYRQQDTLSKPYRGGGHSYNSWQRSKSPRQQRGRWGSSSPNRAHSPGDKRHQTEDEGWKGSRYSSQRTRPDKRKAVGEQDGFESKKRRTEAGGPRSPSATPPPPPDMEEPRPQQPSEPPPTQPDPPLPSEGSFMPASSKEPTATAVTVPIPSTVSQQVYVSQPPQQQIAQQPGADTLVELLRRYPVMWQGHFTLKNDMAAVQLHFLSGNMELAKKSLPFPTPEKPTPSLRIAQRMRLEATQIEGVEKRIQMAAEHCLLLALPCGRDPLDVHAQTRALKTSFISYLMQKQAAGIINITGLQQASFVLHIFPPCPFSHGHLARVAPDLLSSASDSGHLMVIIATA